MPPLTWAELVLAMTVIGLRRAWLAWRGVPTYRPDDDITPPDPDPLTRRVRR